MTVQELAEGVIAGDRRALARAITRVESARADHRAEAVELVAAARAAGRQALRIGLSGTPGVGKSTFIESFGMMLLAQGLRVAVLAVDPSSARSGGSILGDKTRMERLSREPAAFIRPSPSQAQMGGVARRTREAVALCEAAGFDVVLVETVGVGQSETVVAEICDLFLLLLAPAGGGRVAGGQARDHGDGRHHPCEQSRWRVEIDSPADLRGLRGGLASFAATPARPRRLSQGDDRFGRGRNGHGGGMG